MIEPGAHHSSNGVLTAPLGSNSGANAVGYLSIMVIRSAENLTRFKTCARDDLRPANWTSFG